MRDPYARRLVLPVTVDRNLAMRQEKMQVVQAFVGDVNVVEFQFSEIGQSLEMPQAKVGELATAET